MAASSPRGGGGRTLRPVAPGAPALEEAMSCDTGYPRPETNFRGVKKDKFSTRLDSDLQALDSRIVGGADTTFISYDRSAVKNKRKVPAKVYSGK